MINLNWHVNEKKCLYINKNKIKMILYPSYISFNLLGYLSKIPYFKNKYKNSWILIDRDGFGKICLKEDDLISSIQTIINNNFVVEEKYLNRMKNEFTFKDGKCSERIYNYLVGENTKIYGL